MNQSKGQEKFKFKKLLKFENSNDALLLNCEIYAMCKGHIYRWGSASQSPTKSQHYYR